MRYKEMADNSEPIIKNITDQIGKLTLVANREGQVIGRRTASSVGQWLKPRQADRRRPAGRAPSQTRADKPYFCEIGDPHRLEAHLILDQADINLLGLDSKAWLKVDGKAEFTYRSKVSEIAPRASDQVPTELSVLSEGEIAVQARPQDRGGQADECRLRDHHPRR